MLKVRSRVPYPYSLLLDFTAKKGCFSFLIFSLGGVGVFLMGGGWSLANSDRQISVTVISIWYSTTDVCPGRWLTTLKIA